MNLIKYIRKEGRKRRASNDVVNAVIYGYKIRRKDTVENTNKQWLEMLIGHF